MVVYGRITLGYTAHITWILPHAPFPIYHPIHGAITGHCSHMSLENQILHRKDTWFYFGEKKGRGKGKKKIDMYLSGKDKKEIDSSEIRTVVPEGTRFTGELRFNLPFFSMKNHLICLNTSNQVKKHCLLGIMNISGLVLCFDLLCTYRCKVPSFGHPTCSRASPPDKHCTSDYI